MHIKSESQIEPLHHQLGGATEAYFNVTHARNLQLRVRATGAKAWLYRKQTSGRRSRMSLGPWPIITLAKAISKAAELNAQAYAGDDIWASRHKAARATLTFGEAAAKWLANKQNVSAGRLQRLTRDLTQHLAALSDTPIRELDAGIVAEAVKPRWGTATAGDLLGTIGHVWGAGVAELGLEISVAARLDQVRQLLPQQVKPAVKQFEMIAVEDLPQWLAGLRNSNSLATRDRVAAEVMLLTNKRPVEVLGADWSEVDLVAGGWRIPGPRIKTRTDHTMPLSARVVTILKEWQAETGGVGLMFQTGPGKSLRPPHLLKSLDRHCPMPVGASGRKSTLHGTSRATFSTWANDHGYASEVVEAQLGHAVGNAVQRAYDRSKRMDLRRQLVEAYAKFTMGEE